MPIFITINGRLINVTDVQLARDLNPDDTRSGESASGCKVYFISGGHTIVPDVSLEMLDAMFSEAVKAAAPF